MATADQSIEEEDIAEEEMNVYTPTQQPISEELASHYSSPYLLQMSVDEYNHQGTEFTQKAVKSLKSSPEFKMHIQQCHSCECSWYHGRWTAGCAECGGHAMRRQCPVCGGKCGSSWTRDIQMSQQLHSAHWNGVCGLEGDDEEWTQHAIRTLAELDNPTTLSEALEDVEM